MNSTLSNNCPICNKPYAHTLGVMGYAGPPFWCQCFTTQPVPKEQWPSLGGMEELQQENELLKLENERLKAENKKFIEGIEALKKIWGIK